MSPGIVFHLFFTNSKASQLLECLHSVLIGKCHNLSTLYIITLIPAEVDFNLYKNTTVQLMPNAKPIYSCPIDHISELWGYAEQGFSRSSNIEERRKFLRSS